MEPFRKSATARLFAASYALAGIGGGLVVALGINDEIGLPIVLLAALGLGVFGAFLGIADHAEQVLLAAVLSPMALWPYVIGLEWMVGGHRGFGWLAVVGGAVAMALAVAGGGPAHERVTGALDAAHPAK